MRASSVILASLGLVFLIALVSHALANENAADMMKMQDQMFTPNVKINITGNTNVWSVPQGFCSGQVIHSDRDKKSGKVETFVLTAKHCTSKVDERMEVLVDQHGKNLGLQSSIHYEATVWGQSYKSDLALLKLDDDEHIFDHVAKLAPKDTVLNFGDKVELVGYPYGFSQTWTEGRLGYVEKANDFFSGLSASGKFFRATPMMAGGNSGSSMFIQDTDGNYKIIGVLTGGAAGFVGFYTPLSEIHDYLDIASEAWKSNEDIVGKKNDKEEEVDFISPTSR